MYPNVPRRGVEVWPPPEQSPAPDLAHPAAPGVQEELREEDGDAGGQDAGVRHEHDGGLGKTNVGKMNCVFGRKPKPLLFFVSSVVFNTTVNFRIYVSTIQTKYKIE